MLESEFGSGLRKSNYAICKTNFLELLPMSFQWCRFEFNFVLWLSAVFRKVVEYIRSVRMTMANICDLDKSLEHCLDGGPRETLMFLNYFRFLNSDLDKNLFFSEGRMMERYRFSVCKIEYVLSVRDICPDFIPYSDADFAFREKECFHDHDKEGDLKRKDRCGEYRLFYFQ